MISYYLLRHLDWKSSKLFLVRNMLTGSDRLTGTALHWSPHLCLSSLLPTFPLAAQLALPNITIPPCLAPARDLSISTFFKGNPDHSPRRVPSLTPATWNCTLSLGHPHPFAFAHSVDSASSPFDLSSGSTSFSTHGSPPWEAGLRGTCLAPSCWLVYVSASWKGPRPEGGFSVFSWCPACGGCALKSDVTPLLVIPCLLVCSQRRWEYTLLLEAVPLSWWVILRDRPCPRESQRVG